MKIAFTWVEIYHHLHTLDSKSITIFFFLSKTTNLSFFSAITVLGLPIARATQATTAPSLEKIVSHFAL